MNKLLLASNNPGKLQEIRTLLAPLAIEIVPQAELGIAEAEEPHATYLENALAKARHASRAGKLPALADDSGLCVHALDGAPGVHSAHYAGAQGSRSERDARNNAKLLAELEGSGDRSAHFVCVVAMLRFVEDAEPLIVEGRWRGSIVHAPRGQNGFGYDPLFLVPGRGLTAAELGAEEKNRISHRGRALARLIECLRERGS